MVSNKIITVSESSARDLSEVFEVPSENITTIPHGIDHGRFHPISEGDPDVTLELQLPAEFALYVGNLDPRKNLVRLCDAFSRPSLQESRLVIAGRPAWDAQPILDKIHDSPNVTYLGPVPEELLSPLLRAAQCFVFPSLYEGFGFPVLEAMACAAPVITTHRGSLKDVAADAAMIVDPDDPDSIADGVAAVLSSSELKYDLIAKGIQNANRFDWQTSARHHAQLFKEVVNGAHTHR
ncbi:hypothetical protein GCM10023226_07350 [Nocardioides nanhaiensis]|uniref:Glycosyl transferase family 1 domain-containing protein n=2 Tax=Nocardioides nanhaiensis TaxID=1476871 RepID=A0ABP8VXG4_9ACTN